MKELSFDQMEKVNGGSEYSYWACNIGMGAVGLLWTVSLSAASAGVASVAVGAAWIGIQGHVCKNA